MARGKEVAIIFQRSETELWEASVTVDPETHQEQQDSVDTEPEQVSVCTPNTQAGMQYSEHRSWSWRGVMGPRQWLEVLAAVGLKSSDGKTSGSPSQSYLGTLEHLHKVMDGKWVAPLIWGFL